MTEVTWKKDRTSSHNIWRSSCGRFRIRLVCRGRYYQTEYKADGRTFQQRGGGIVKRPHKTINEAKIHIDEVDAFLAATE